MVRTARTRAGYTAQDFAEATGVSTRTLWALEAGEREPSAATMDRVEAELDWPAGEITHLARGGRPRRRTYPPDLAEIIRAWPGLSPDARAMLVQLVRAAAQSRTSP